MGIEDETTIVRRVECDDCGCFVAGKSLEVEKDYFVDYHYRGDTDLTYCKPCHIKHKEKAAANKLDVIVVKAEKIDLIRKVIAETEKEYRELLVEISELKK